MPLISYGGTSAVSLLASFGLVMAARQRPPPTEEEVRRSEVDTKAEELVAEFQDDEQRRQRLDSIFNYTQMLKRPSPTEEGARRSEVDAEAEELVAELPDEQRRRRLDSIFNYTQMLKQRAAAGRRPQPAPAAAQL